MWSHQESLVTSQYPSKCASPLYTAVRCSEVRIFISKKHLKAGNERNRDNLFNVINYILANQVTIMKKTLYYRAGFPKLCAVKGIKVCREIFVFLIESHRVNGGYWVRRMRQLPRAPLKIPHIVSFCCICFFRDHHDFRRKIAKYEIKSKWRPFFVFFRDYNDFERKIAKYEIKSKWI